MLGLGAAERARRLVFGVLSATGVRRELRAHMVYYYESIAHIQLAFRRLKLQRTLNLEYATLRFRQELSRVGFFYLQKAGRNRTAAKVVTKLDDLDMRKAEVRLGA